MEMEIKALDLKNAMDVPDIQEYLSNFGFETPLMTYYRVFEKMNGVEPTKEQTKNYVKTCLDKSSEEAYNRYEKYLMFREYAPKDFVKFVLSADQDDDRKILLAWGFSFRGITDSIYFYKHEFENMPEIGWDTEAIILDALKYSSLPQ